MTRTLRWLRVAAIDLRGDLRRFAVLLACLALGVGTIAAVGSVGSALQAAISRDAAVILGGDLEARLGDRPALPGERGLFENLGRLSEVVELTARATSETGSAFLSIRAGDANYPLLGTIETGGADGRDIASLLASTGETYGAIVDAAVLTRLGIGIGESFRIGAARFQARATLTALPDQAAQGFQLGLPVLISTDAAKASGALREGALTRYRYKIDLEGHTFEEAEAAITAAFPDADWQIRSPEDATSTLSRFFDLFGRFLVLVGLSSLLVGGVGVSNAVAAYITERRTSIATLRSLGATGARILVHFFAQILLMSVCGIALGLLLGAAASLLALPFLGSILALDLDPTLDIGALLVAVGFGLLVALVFALPPLRGALLLRPALLFRSGGAPAESGHWRARLAPGLLVPLGVGVLGLGALAMIDTGQPMLVVWYGLGAALAFVLLRASGWVLQRLLRLLPSPRQTELRLAVSSMVRPRSPAPTVILSLGLGLSLLVMIALTDGSLRAQISGQLAEEAPSFILPNLDKERRDEIEALAAGDERIAGVETTPVLRASIAAVKDSPVAELPTLPEDIAGLFRGDISVTWSHAIPEGSTVIEGEWWPQDYAGEPLVSLGEDLREPLGLTLGDSIDLTVVGRPVRLVIASFREIDFNTSGMNFRFVLSPGLIEQAPARYTLALSAAPGQDEALEADLATRFPELTMIPVAQALDRAAGILGSLANAVGLIGGLAVVSGALVLAGAMSVGRRQRDADAVVMKILGATRAGVILAFVLEYALLGALSGLLALMLGSLGAFAVVRGVLELPFAFDLPLAAIIVGGAVILTVSTGVLTTWSSLSVQPARKIRDGLT